MKGYIFPPFAAMLAALFLLLAVSCTSVHKFQDKVTEALAKKATYSNDSTVVKYTDSSRVKGTTNIMKTLADSSYTRITISEDFDLGGHNDTVTALNSPLGVTLPFVTDGEEPVTVKPDNGSFYFISEHSRLVHRTTVYERGVKTETTNTENTMSDSTGLRKNERADVKAAGDSSIQMSESHETKTVIRTRTSSAVIISLFTLLGLFVVYSIWKRTPWVAAVSKLFNQNHK